MLEKLRRIFQRTPKCPICRRRTGRYMVDLWMCDHCEVWFHTDLPGEVVEATSNKVRNV